MYTLTLYSIGTLFLNLFIILVSLEAGDEVGLQWVNPIVIYDNVPVNWFGCIILTILAHIAAGPWTILYWFYKLCTMGRK